MAEIHRDLTRTTLAIMCILLLTGGSLWILRPFLAAAVWATMIVVATWPLLRSLEQRLGNRRGLAVAIMTLAMLLLLVVPLGLAIDTIANHTQDISNLASKVASKGLPQPPEWVAALPLVGEKMATFWRELADSGSQGLLTKLTPYVADTGKWLVGQLGGLGMMLFQFLLILALSAILYANGEAGAAGMRRFGNRLAGQRGEDSIVLAGQAIRGVALGVGVTAIVQTVLSGISLAIAGVPFASLLSAVILMLCIAQLGPGLILFPAVGWMFWNGDTTWASVLLVCSVIITALDNVLRPMLIKKGADLPLLLIFAGVIGGMLSFGLIGIFVGPVVLAVTYTLLEDWIADGQKRGNAD
ncbi:MAG: AI-2E family transporter YdiK [Rhodoferax sp.]